MSRAASSDTPAGRPSTMTVSCGPCDSPAVRNRSICNGLYWRAPISPVRAIECASGLSVPGLVWHPRLDAMSEAPRTRTSVHDHLRIARILDAHGDVIGAICAYREVMRVGPEAAATE